MRTTALLVLTQRDRLPNLAQITVSAAMATFPVGTALMVIANLAALRDRREGMPEALGALPGRADAWTRAVLLAAVCVGAVQGGRGGGASAG
ncbi:MAG: hypothetical protein ACRDNL_09470 [Spirillospora sp.]